MSGQQLKEIAIKLYGERGWQKKLSAALNRDVSTIRRYVETDKVPPIVELAVQSLNR